MCSEDSMRIVGKDRKNEFMQMGISLSIYQSIQMMKPRPERFAFVPFASESFGLAHVC